MPRRCRSVFAARKRIEKKEGGRTKEEKRGKTDEMAHETTQVGGIGSIRGASRTLMLAVPMVICWGKEGWGRVSRACEYVGVWMFLSLLVLTSTLGMTAFGEIKDISDGAVVCACVRYRFLLPFSGHRRNFRLMGQHCYNVCVESLCVGVVCCIWAVVCLFLQFCAQRAPQSTASPLGCTSESCG